jgi:ethanolamine-phosphate phospho-lyase
MESIIAEKLGTHFGLTVSEITQMNGYETNNYRVDTPDGIFVCKLHEVEELDAISAETHLLLFLQDRFPFETPSPIPIDANSWFVSIEHEGKQHLMRLISFLEGELLAENQAGQELWSNLGSFTAQLHVALEPFRSYEIEARKQIWDLGYAQLNWDNIEFIEAKEDRKYIQYFMDAFEQKILPIQHQLPSQIIQNDGNDWNILTHHQEVTGIIDFGDVCWGPRIYDIAITLTYLMMDEDFPLNVGEVFLQAYCQDGHLSQSEVDLLHLLIGLRLSVSILNSAKGKKESPLNHYLVVSQRGAWELLRKWVKINPIEVQDRFRKACGLDLAQRACMQELQEQRAAIFPSAMSLAYSPSPIVMKGALFQCMFDDQGKSYLDFYNNIPHVGHQHPNIIAAINKQLFELNTNSRYLLPIMNQYGKRLLEKFKSPINKLFLVNDGSAASDLAIRIARQKTKREAIIIMEHGYHGHTSTGIAISNYKHAGKGGNGTPENIHVLPLPDMYRNPEKLESQIEEAVAIIKAVKPACFISESIVGCGGQVPLPPSYAQAIHAAVRENGGYCIADEVQTGFGRTGNHFWAFEGLELSPDMVVMGKSMGNGHPIAGLALSDELAESISNGMEFFSSYGANPVSCAAGIALLDVLEQEQLQGNSRDLGNYLKEQLLNMVADFEELGDVRGEGLFLGLDIVSDGKSKKENPELAREIQRQFKKHGILVGTDGPQNSVIKIKPPLCVSASDIDEFLDIFQKILRK